MKPILFIHRYLAVAVGLLMTLWCLSGFVMMYQAMPELSSEERLNGLQTLELQNCCNLGDYLPHDDTPLGNFRMEMLLGEPVLRFNNGPQNQTLNLVTGALVHSLTQPQILEIASAHAAGNHLAASPLLRGVIEFDQWTIQSARRNQPAWQLSLQDPAATDIYINGHTGEVFQQTNQKERVLAWLGVIPHWLYPTLLRQNGALWTQIVIWTSISGCFLAATGLYVGVKRLRRQRGTNRLKSSYLKSPYLKSPYKGWWHWHHISGLIFGVLVLTWVFSGLMTMNPWGALSGGSAFNYRPQLTGSANWGQMRQFLASVSEDGLDLPNGAEIVQLSPAVFGGRLFVMAVTRDGQLFRMDSRAQLSPLTTADIEQLVTGIETPITRAGLMYQEDNYYYGHKREVPLPVYRVIMEDAERTRIYINTETGAVRSLGSTGRWSRWLRTGLHDLDFPILRLRPLWDVVVILLLTGVTTVCATGTWMAVRRVRRDILSVRRRWQ